MRPAANDPSKVLRGSTRVEVHVGDLAVVGWMLPPEPDVGITLPWPVRMVAIDPDGAIVQLAGSDRLQCYRALIEAYNDEGEA